jgi:carbonic anhydrase
MENAPKFASGVLRFRREVFPERRALFENLSSGQAPEACFITCSDSRIETGMLTQTEPGELFVCRNAGNIVPPHSHNTGGITASIEYAVAVLNVGHIVICGHTECGAMRAAMNHASTEKLRHVRNWLLHAEAAVDIVNEIAPNKTTAERLALVTEQNVILQLRHLETHPAVATRIARGDLSLHGWVYDIASGSVRAWSPAARQFLPVEQAYA